MIQRLGVLILVGLAVTTAVPAAADARLSIDRAKQAIGAALRSGFEGGVKKGSMRLDCERDGAAVRCDVQLDDRRGRPWTGSASARIARPANADPRIVTHFTMRRTGER